MFCLIQYAVWILTEERPNIPMLNAAKQMVPRLTVDANKSREFWEQRAEFPHYKSQCSANTVEDLPTRISEISVLERKDLQLVERITRTCMHYQVSE